MGECHSVGRFLWLGSSFVLFKNIDSGLDIYGMLTKLSEDMELEERANDRISIQTAFNRAFFSDPAKIHGSCHSLEPAFQLAM